MRREAASGAAPRKARRRGAELGRGREPRLCSFSGLLRTGGRHTRRLPDRLQIEELPFEFPELAAESSAEAARLVREGLPAGRFKALRAFLDISTAELSEVVGITSSTLSRRRKRGFFAKDESERLLRLARIALRAVDVMEGAENARQWLTKSARALGGESPLHFADTEPGAREVERLLGRIEHGVFS